MKRLGRSQCRNGGGVLKPRRPPVKSRNNAARQPVPRFKPLPNDPSWLVDAVRLHGHLGPWLVVGLRIGQHMLSELACEGFFDIQVQVSGPIAKPPSRCMVDGLQHATGATLGKGNISVRVARCYRLQARNTKSGRTVQYRLCDGLLTAIQRTTMETAESISRQVARQSFDEIAECVARH